MLAARSTHCAASAAAQRLRSTQETDRRLLIVTPRVFLTTSQGRSRLKLWCRPKRARICCRYEVRHSCLAGTRGAAQLSSDTSTTEATPLVFRSTEELIHGGVVCSTQFGRNVDFSQQSLVHFQLTWACPGESGSRVLGVTQDRSRDVLQVHVHVWSSNEGQAACHRSYWLAVNALPPATAVEVMRFSPCDHPKDCKM